MGVITLDDGRSFTVEDSFGNLPANRQQEIVGELKKQLPNQVAKQIASGTRAAAGSNDELPKHIDQAIRSIAQGVTLGYADRIAAKLGDLTGIGGKAGDYAGNLKAEQAKTAETPGAISVPGQIGGAVLGAAAGGPAIGAAAKAIPGVAAIPSVVRTAIGGAAAGAAAGASQSEDITQQGVKNATTGAITGAATGGTLAVGGKFLGALGDKIMTSVIRPTAKDLADGFSLDTIKRFDLGGSLNTTYAKTQAALGDLTNQLRAKLAGSKADVSLSKAVADTETELSTSTGKLKNFGSNSKIGAVIDGLKEEVRQVGSLVSVPDAQLVKQAAGKKGAWYYGRQEPDAAESERVYSTFYNKLKTQIENASPAGVKEINADIGKLIPVSNALVRRMPVADRNYAISLGDLVTLAAAWSHPPTLALTGLNLAQKSGAVGNQLSKLGPRIAGAATPAATISGLGSPIFNQE